MNLSSNAASDQSPSLYTTRAQNSSYARLKVIKKYGHFSESETKFVIEPYQLKKFLLDQRISHLELQEFLMLKKREYYHGFSSLMLVQFLLEEAVPGVFPTDGQVERALSYVFSAEDELPEEHVEDRENKANIDGASRDQEELSHAELEHLHKRLTLVALLRDTYLHPVQCVTDIAALPYSQWKTFEVIPEVTLREAVSTVILGPHSSTQSEQNISLRSMRKWVDHVWNRGQELHIGGKHLLDIALDAALREAIIKETPDPVAFCNRYIGDGENPETNFVLGHPRNTISRIFGTPLWATSYPSTLAVMQCLWPYHEDTKRILSWHASHKVLAADHIENEWPLADMTPTTRAKLLYLPLIKTYSPDELKEKISQKIHILLKK